MSKQCYFIKAIVEVSIFSEDNIREPVDKISAPLSDAIETMDRGVKAFKFCKQRLTENILTKLKKELDRQKRGHYAKLNEVYVEDFYFVDEGVCDGE